MKSSKSRQRLTLGAVILVSTVLWGFVLPRVAQRPAMRDKVEHLRQRGIDPGALFYSDHPSAFPGGSQPKTMQ